MLYMRRPEEFFDRKAGEFFRAAMLSCALHVSLNLHDDTMASACTCKMMVELLQFFKFLSAV